MRAIRGLILAGLVVASLAVSLIAQAPPSGTAASAPAALSLAAAIKAIKDASTVAEAAAAYSSASEADRKGADLNTAYMRRLLQLAQPQLAGTPAAELASIPVSDGMAYGVIGYNSGRENDLPKALTNTMKAAGVLKDDTSIQSNLGQLVAWYESAKTFKLSQEDQDALERLKTEMSTQKAYVDGYQAVKDGYDKFAEANAEAHQKLAAAEAAVTAGQKKVADDQTQIKNLEAEEANAVKQRNALAASGGGGPGMGRRGGGGMGGGGQMAQLNKTINDIETVKKPAANKALQDDQAALTQKTQARDKLKNAPPAAVPLAKLFYWLPPAVDGVVTMPPGTTTRPTTQPASGTAGP